MSHEDYERVNEWLEQAFQGHKDVEGLVVNKLRSEPVLESFACRRILELCRKRETAGEGDACRSQVALAQIMSELCRRAITSRKTLNSLTPLLLSSSTARDAFCRHVPWILRAMVLSCWFARAPRVEEELLDDVIASILSDSKNDTLDQKMLADPVLTGMVGKGGSGVCPRDVVAAVDTLIKVAEDHVSDEKVVLLRALRIRLQMVQGDGQRGGGEETKSVRLRTDRVPPREAMCIKAAVMQCCKVLQGGSLKLYVSQTSEGEDIPLSVILYKLLDAKKGEADYEWTSSFIVKLWSLCSWTSKGFALGFINSLSLVRRDTLRDYLGEAVFLKAVCRDVLIQQARSAVVGEEVEVESHVCKVIVQMLIEALKEISIHSSSSSNVEDCSPAASKLILHFFLDILFSLSSVRTIAEVIGMFDSKLGGNVVDVDDTDDGYHYHHHLSNSIRRNLLEFLLMQVSNNDMDVDIGEHDSLRSLCLNICSEDRNELLSEFAVKLWKKLRSELGEQPGQNASHRLCCRPTHIQVILIALSTFRGSKQRQKVDEAYRAKMSKEVGEGGKEEEEEEEEAGMLGWLTSLVETKFRDNIRHQYHHHHHHHHHHSGGSTQVVSTCTAIELGSWLSSAAERIAIQEEAAFSASDYFAWLRSMLLKGRDDVATCLADSISSGHVEFSLDLMKTCKEALKSRGREWLAGLRKTILSMKVRQQVKGVGEKERRSKDGNYLQLFHVLLNKFDNGDGCSIVMSSLMKTSETSWKHFLQHVSDMTADKLFDVRASTRDSEEEEDEADQAEMRVLIRMHFARFVNAVVFLRLPQHEILKNRLISPPQSLLDLLLSSSSSNATSSAAERQDKLAIGVKVASFLSSMADTTSLAKFLFNSVVKLSFVPSSAFQLLQRFHLAFFPPAVEQQFRDACKATNFDCRVCSQLALLLTCFPGVKHDRIFSIDEISSSSLSQPPPTLPTFSSPPSSSSSCGRRLKGRASFRSPAAVASFWSGLVSST
eukprot:767045-Hanusia_phi.AAC.1